MFLLHCNLVSFNITLIIRSTVLLSGFLQVSDKSNHGFLHQERHRTRRHQLYPTKRENQGALR